MRSLFRRRGFATLLATVAVAVLGAAAPAHAEPAAPDLGRPLSLAEVQARIDAAPAATIWFKIMNWHSKQFLTVSAPVNVDGSPIVQRSIMPGNQAQAWTLTPVVNGYQSLRSGATSSWKALGISASNPANGGKAISWTYVAGLADQKWHQSGSWFGVSDTQLVNLNSKRCLGIPGSSTVEGVQAIQWDCKTGLEDQYWVFYSWP